MIVSIVKVQCGWGTTVQGVLLHLGYDGWWEQDMQEIPLKRMSDAKVGTQYHRYLG